MTVSILITIVGGLLCGIFAAGYDRLYFTETHNTVTAMHFFIAYMTGCIATRNRVGREVKIPR